MDAAAPRAKPKRDKPLIPPHYVSLRDLQELRLKEKEEQRRREEEAAASRVNAAAAAAAAAVAAAQPVKETKTSSGISSWCKERSRGGQHFVAAAHRPPPPPRVEGTARKKDGATGIHPGEKGTEGDTRNASEGGGSKGDYKGKEKVSAPVDLTIASSHGCNPKEDVKAMALGEQGSVSGATGASGEPAWAAIAPSRGRFRSENRHKGKGSGGRSIEIATASAPDKMAEAADASPRRGFKTENDGKKESSEGSPAYAARSSNSPDGMRAHPPTVAESSNRRNGGGRGSPGTIREAKFEGLGEKQPLVDVRAQPLPFAEGNGNRRIPLSDGGKREKKWKAKSPGDQAPETSGASSQSAEAATTSCRGRVKPEKYRGEKGSTTQTAMTSTSGETTKVADASPPQDIKSENKGKKKTSAGSRSDVPRGSVLPDGKRAQPCPAAEGSKNQQRSGGQGTTEESNSGDLGEKQPVMEVTTVGQRKRWSARSSAGLRRGSGHGNGAAIQNGMVWVPKVNAFS